MTRFQHALVSAPAVFLLLASASGARADGGSAANALFDEGRRLMEAGNYAQACPKFVDSQKLDPGVGTMLNLAVCYEKNGQTASAWSEYRDAAAAARDKGQVEREQIARAGAARLETRLFKVVIGVSSQPNEDDITLELDGTPTPKGLWGVPTPIDPGKHRVEAKARTKTPWSTTFEVTGPSTPPVTVPVLEAAPVSVGAEPATSGSAHGEVAAQPRDGKGQRTAAIVVGGVGVVGVAVGSIFGLMAKPTYNKSDPFCNGDHCTDQGHQYRDSALAKAEIATVGFVIGGVGLVGGAILWLTAPKKTESGVAFVVAPFVAQTSSGVAVKGVW